MKKTRILGLFLLLFVLTSFSAFAQLSVPAVDLGGASQERAEYTSKTVSITNNGDDTITDIVVTFESVNSDYDVSYTLSDNETAAGASVDLTVTGFVPLWFDAVNAKGQKVDFVIGTIKVDAVNDSNALPLSYQVELSMEAENLLKFSESDILYVDNDNDEKDKSLDDGDSYKEVQRDQDVTVNLEVENKFDNNGDCNDVDDYGDCSIEDVEIEFEPDDSDFDEDTFDLGDIKSEDTDSESFTFDIPDDVNEDNYDFELWVTGDDENGARHGEFMKFTLEVEVPRDQITIKDAYLNPDTVDCDQGHVTLRVNVENTGSRDQDEVVIEVKSDLLGVNMLSYPDYIELEEEDDATESFDITLPDDVDPGVYYFIVTANYDGDEESDTESVTLVIEECGFDFDDEDEDDFDFGDEDDDEDDSNTEVNIIEVPPSTGIIYGDDKVDEEVNFFDTPQYLMLLGGLFLFALLIFFVLLVVILRK